MKLGILTSAKYSQLPQGEAEALEEMDSLIEPTMLIWDQVPAWELKKFDALLVRTCWDYHLKFAKFTKWMEEIRSEGIVVVNPATTILWNADKRYLFDLVQWGLPVVPSYDGHHLQSLQSEHPNCKKVIAKKLVSASSHELRLLPLTSVFSEDHINPDEVILQPYLEDIEINGEWSLIYFGDQFSHAVHKLPRKGDHRTQREFGGSVVFKTPPGVVLELGNRTVTTLRFPFQYARIDVIETALGELLMEVELIEPDLFIGTPEAKLNYQQFLEKVVFDATARQNNSSIQ